MTTIPRTKSQPQSRWAQTAPALLQHIGEVLDDGKAEDIVVIDLQGKSNFADYMVVATGRSQRQVVGLAERIKSALRDKHQMRVSMEGLAYGDWVLIDAGDIIVHLFRPEVRRFYNLEKMWGAALPETGLAL